jgi:hypothetical protein
MHIFALLAAIHLIEQKGGVVAGIATINMDDNPLPARLRQQYTCHALWVDCADYLATWHRQQKRPFPLLKKRPSRVLHLPDSANL